jgi:ribose/xylose/arabinose/galactoside ABC-type transport system permease subunit
MSDEVAVGTRQTSANRPKVYRRLELRSILPAVALAVMLGVIFLLQPRAMSYNGLRLLLVVGLPLMFAAMAQLCIIAASDIDLGIGTFIGLVNCVTAK